MFAEKRSSISVTLGIVDLYPGGVDCGFTCSEKEQNDAKRQTGERFSAVSLAWAKTSLLKTEICAYAFVT